MAGPLVETKKPSGCLRYQWAQANVGLSKEELRHDIGAEYQALGALDEWRYAAKLEKEGIAFEREVPFKVPYKNCVISGRQDFVLEDGTIIEKKSTTSEHLYKLVFEQGQPDPAHVAQLASYLAFLKKPRGKIVVTYYELSKEFGGFEVIDEKEFIVESLDGVVLTVNTELYPKTVKDLARWYALMQSAISTPDVLPAKPVLGPLKFKNPCSNCPLSTLCESSDDLTDVASFLHKSRQAFLEPGTPRKFKIATNTDRRKKNRDKKKEARESD